MVEKSRWVCLAVVVLCLVADFFVLAPFYETEAESQMNHFPGQRGSSLLLFTAFVSIWWPEVIGAAIVHTRFGWIPDSLAMLVRVLGWGLLLLGVVMRVDLIFERF